MRLEIALLAAVLVGPSAGRSPSQKNDVPFTDEAQYRERMNEIDHAFTELSKHRHVQNGAAVERESTKLADLFGRVERFWKARGDEERAGFARMARDGAEKAREAAERREQKDFTAAIDIIAASCRGCHREPLDKYRLEIGKR